MCVAAVGREGRFPNSTAHLRAARDYCDPRITPKARFECVNLFKLDLAGCHGRKQGGLQKFRST